MNEIEPVWAAEIEPFPIKVTKARFPLMKHLGDVRNIDGGKIEPVDVITGGSPCQNLSIAGDRNGINGEKSGLFFEMIRIVKEMRVKTNGRYPRYLLTENVNGIYSSGNGEDFRIYLEEICKIADPEAFVPKPAKWQPSGTIMGNDYSISWRTFDAQYWGVPQRRKRMYLVADFGGKNSGEILFKSECLSWDFEKSKGKRAKIARNVGKISNQPNQSLVKRPAAYILDNHATDSRCSICKDNISPTLASRMGTGGNNTPLILEEKQYFVSSKNSFHTRVQKGVVSSLVATDYKDPPIIYAESKDAESNRSDEPLYTIRRITPLECCRLQGFPDYWTKDIEVKDPNQEQMDFWKGVWNHWNDLENKKHKSENQIKKWLHKRHTEAAEYKMWGNGIALPCADFIMQGIVAISKRETM